MDENLKQKVLDRMRGKLTAEEFAKLEKALNSIETADEDEKDPPEPPGDPVP